MEVRNSGGGKTVTLVKKVDIDNLRKFPSVGILSF
jgi:hypothetical protein